MVRQLTIPGPPFGRLRRRASEAARLSSNVATTGTSQAPSGDMRDRPTPVATSVRTISPARLSTPRALS